MKLQLPAAPNTGARAWCTGPFVGANTLDCRITTGNTCAATWKKREHKGADWGFGPEPNWAHGGGLGAEELGDQSISQETDMQAGKTPANPTTLSTPPSPPPSNADRISGRTPLPPHKLCVT